MRTSMNMGVNRTGEAEEFRDLSHQPSSKALRATAMVLSYVFHPLFIPVYIIWLLLSTKAYMFAQFSAPQKIITLLRFFITYSFFPLVTVLLLKGLGFLKSIHLPARKDRIIPFIACGVYYFYQSYVLRHQAEFSREIVQLSMAIFIASSAGLMANIYMKVSLHSIAMGILVAFLGLLAFTQSSNYTLFLSLGIFVAGLVCTARLIVSDHTPAEIYTGLLVGLGSMLLAVWADGILP